MKKIVLGILSLVMIGTMGTTIFATENVTLKINGIKISNTSFEECIRVSGVASSGITSLEIVTGSIDKADWAYIIGQSGGGNAPNMAESLESLVINNDVALESIMGTGANEIMVGAFQYDTKLKTAYTGSTQAIMDMAFLGCTSLIQVTAPNVTMIAGDAFEDCTALKSLNLPAIPPKADFIRNSPSDKRLGFVSTNGLPLTGPALENALSAYRAVNDGNTTDDFWYGWKISNSSDMISPDTIEDSTVDMIGKTIPAPTYTVSIPESLDFGSITKKIKNVSDEDAMAKTIEKAIRINYSNLFDNQKNISVTVSTDNEILKEEHRLTFELYEKGNENDTKITTETKIFAIQPTQQDIDIIEEKTIYAKLDQRLIKASGNYSGTVTFTVAIADNK